MSRNRPRPVLWDTVQDYTGMFGLSMTIQEQGPKEAANLPKPKYGGTARCLKGSEYRTSSSVDAMLITKPIQEPFEDDPNISRGYMADI